MYGSDQEKNEFRTIRRCSVKVHPEYFRKYSEEIGRKDRLTYGTLAQPMFVTPFHTERGKPFVHPRDALRMFGGHGKPTSGFTFFAPITTQNRLPALSGATYTALRQSRNLNISHHPASSTNHGRTGAFAHAKPVIDALQRAQLHRSAAQPHRNGPQTPRDQ